MNINFHIDFEGKNDVSFDIEHEPVSPDEFEQVLKTIKVLIEMFRDL